MSQASNSTDLTLEPPAMEPNNIPTSTIQDQQAGNSELETENVPSEIIAFEESQRDQSIADTQSASTAEAPSRSLPGFAHADHRVEPAEPDSLPRRRVLVVDDDPVIRMLLKMALPSHGYDCLTAEHGKDAQDILRDNCFDVIVVDLLMPVMDGLSFIRWLRQTALNPTPVLVFTNVVDPKIAHEARECGANYLVRKPLHLKALVEAMNILVAVT